MTYINNLTITPYESGDLVLIKAITNLHPGIGRKGDIVDLPVQKDNFGFPIIYSSSLKGALKSTIWFIDQNLATTLFGSEPEEDEKFISTVAILDAFTVTFPARSLEGVYAYVTSPLLLKRLVKYLEILNKNLDYLYELSKIQIADNKCYTSSSAENTLKLSVQNMENKILINEEIALEINIDMEDKIKELEKFLNIDEGRLILLSDDNALAAMERSLVRVTRIAVDRERKTVKGSALWSEEYVPCDTTFITVLLYSKVRQKNKVENQTSQNVRNTFHELLAKKLRNYLIIGGNETIGKGIVKIYFKD